MRGSATDEFIFVNSHEDLYMGVVGRLTLNLKYNVSYQNRSIVVC